METSGNCRIIQNEGERRIARDIVRRMYVAQGYKINSDDFKYYLNGPNSTVFGLFEKDTLYGTISVIVDGERGLPMDSVYKNELAPWRSGGKKLAEVVQFAVDHDAYAEVSGRKPAPFVAAPLFSAVLSYAIQNNIDYLCISINPKHDRFYSMLGFKQVGEMKHYDSVGAPAIARALYVPGRNSLSTISISS